jgi:hypothetical protein
VFGIDIIQIVSLLGALLCLVPFAAIQLKLLSSDKLMYLLMNFIGSGILAIVAIIQQEYGFILMESIWAAVSFYGLYNLTKNSLRK